MTDRQTDGQSDRQTSAPFHDMATRSGPHNNTSVCGSNWQPRDRIEIDDSYGQHI